MKMKMWHVGQHEPPSEVQGTVGTVSLDCYQWGEHTSKIQIHGEAREELAAAICAFLNRRKTK